MAGSLSGAEELVLWCLVVWCEVWWEEEGKMTNRVVDEKKLNNLKCGAVAFETVIFVTVEVFR